MRSLTSAVAVHDPSHDPVTCRLCNGALGPPLLVHSVRDRFEVAVGVDPHGYSRAWRRCISCTVVQNVQYPANEAKLDSLAAAYYEVDLGNEIRAKFDRVMAMPRATSDNASRVRRIIKRVERSWTASDTSLHVVDIGAGLGVFVARFLEETGGKWHATAVEPDPDAAWHLRSLSGFDVVEAVLSEQGLPIAPADLLTLNKVLEHLADPARLLRDACKLLNPDKSMMYIEVPDELTIFRRPATDNILGGLHKNLYSPRSLSTLIESAGLECIQVERVFEPSGKISVFAFAVPVGAIDHLDSRFGG